MYSKFQMYYPIFTVIGVYQFMNGIPFGFNLPLPADIMKKGSF